MNASLRRWLIGAVVLFLLLLALTAVKPYLIVGAGQRAVIFNVMNGSLTQVGEGFHFVLPFVNRWYLYNVRTRTYTMSKTQWEGEVKGDDSIRALTSDGQEVLVDISVRFHPDPDNVWRLHQEIGKDYINKIIRPEVRSHTRIVIAEFPVTMVYSEERQTIEDRIAQRLTASLSKNYIQVDEVLLRNIQFSEAFSRAVEEKQIAQQEAQRMQYVLEKAEKERQKLVVEAEGEAQAMDLKGKALAENPQVIQYEYVQKIAPNVRLIITDGRSLTPPFALAPRGK